MHCLTSLALVLLAPASIAQQSTIGTAVFDIGSLPTTTDEGASDLTIFDPFMLEENWGERKIETESFNSGPLVQLFKSVLDLDNEVDQYIVTRGDSDLILTADAQRLELARQLYEFLRSSLGVTRQFEVLAFDTTEAGLPNTPSGAVLSAADASQRVDALTASGSEVKRWVLSVDSGRTALLRSESTVPFVYSYNVEIASEAFAYDPRICNPRLGDLLAARAAPAGDATRLSLFLRHTEAIGELEALNLDYGGFVGDEANGEAHELYSSMTIERLDVAFHGFGIQVILGEGEAIELTIEGGGTEGGRAGYLIRSLTKEPGAVSRFQVGEVGSPAELLLVESEEQGAVGLYANYELTPFRHGSKSEGKSVRLPAGDPRQIVNRVRGVGNGLFGGQIGFKAAYLYVPDAQSELELGAALATTASGSPRHRVLAASVDAGSNSVAKFKIPTLDGVSGFAFVAQGGLRISDAQVEVATGASVRVPEVNAVYEGAFFEWQAHEGGSVSIEAASSIGKGRQVPLGSIGRGIVEPHSQQLLRDRQSLVSGKAELGVRGGDGLGATVTLQ